jgi:hypothetical protein
LPMYTAMTTTPPSNISDSTTGGSFGDANTTAQTGGNITVRSGSNTAANTDQVVAYILLPILALLALLAIALCFPFVIRIARRRAAAAAAAAAAKLPLAPNQIPLQPPNFRRPQPVWNWYERGQPSLYAPGIATRPDQVNGYSRF